MKQTQFLVCPLMAVFLFIASFSIIKPSLAAIAIITTIGITSPQPKPINFPFSRNKSMGVT
jgi:hypothetical protein